MKKLYWFIGIMVVSFTVIPFIVWGVIELARVYGWFFSNVVGLTDGADMAQTVSTFVSIIVVCLAGLCLLPDND